MPCKPVVWFWIHRKTFCAVFIKNERSKHIRLLTVKVEFCLGLRHVRWEATGLTPLFDWRHLWSRVVEGGNFNCNVVGKSVVWETLLLFPLHAPHVDGHWGWVSRGCLRNSARHQSCGVFSFNRVISTGRCCLHAAPKVGKQDSGSHEVRGGRMLIEWKTCFALFSTLSERASPFRFCCNPLTLPL